ncbi:MAG TPA: hypothetical protein VH165_27550 [Kofleriaceae bacterium]|nr:hypothetical protein [Kofleriaceae bacterium]
MTDDEISVADNIRVCANAADQVQCHARVLVDAYGDIRTNATPAGLGAATLRSFYGITSNGSTATTVAIVDSNGYPNALRDVQMYRSTFGLPTIVKCAVGGARPCLAVVNQTGGTSLPATDVGWDQETALDLDMVSAMCPNCNILLVQGTSATFANLATAMGTAASNTAATGARAVAVSNSYGGGEAGSTSFAAAYLPSGVAVTASSGDSGNAAGPQFPASATNATQTVIAVGGTSVHVGSSPRETVWSGAGSGCSTVYARASWQPANATAKCAKRAYADISAVADPNTGVAVYAPTSATASSFQVFGGTSVASPLIAGIIGSIGSATTAKAIYAASNSGDNFDVTSGTNGTCGSPLCTAGVGWDGPTGLGTPIGPGEL